MSDNATPLEGMGRSNSKLLLITYYPSASEDKHRKHFPFDEGVLLENMLNSIGLSSKHFYITTVLKCKPEYDVNPTKEQVETCVTNHLVEEIKRVNPQYFLALGSDIGKYIHGTKFAITKNRGQCDFLNLTGVVTYHPKYLLRFPSLEVGSPKWQAWQDLITFKDLLENGVPF